MVATVSSSGLVKSSSQYTCGNACASSRFIRRARRTRPSRVSLSHLRVDAATVTDASVLTTSDSGTADRWHFVIPMRPAPCLLLRVSWLLVAFIPGLLMLATIGLGRLESALGSGPVSPSDVAEFLQQADADDVDTLVRDG